MSRRTYSGKDIIKALSYWGFKQTGRSGSHVKLRYKNPNTGKVRTVIVPLKDELATGTLKSISVQAGADDFQKFLDEMDKMI